MKKMYYKVDKIHSDIVNGYIDYHQIKGFDIKPLNNVPYEGIEVNHLKLIEPKLIEIVLKRKTRRKLDAYLNFLLTIIDEDEDDSDALQFVIDDAEKYKNIIINKYSKFLDKKYINSLLRKIRLIEKELKIRLKELSIEEKEIGKRR